MRSQIEECRVQHADCPKQGVPVLSPSAQARYHLGCAWRHCVKAGAAASSTRWFWHCIGIAMGLVCLALLPGCVTSSNGVRWSPLVPTTWPIFSGEHSVNASKRAEKKADKQAARVGELRDDAVHAAHVEFFKSNWVLRQMPQSSSRDLAYRFSGNGLSLLDQADPLAAWEIDGARSIAADFLSGDSGRVAAAEAKQREVETANTELSRRLAAAEAKAAKLSQLLRSANADLRDSAAEAIELANQVRIFRWGLGAAVVLIILLGAAAIYARLALGGVGAALHAAGAPAQVINALDGELSKLGQWLVRTGREAAAKIAAKKALS